MKNFDALQKAIELIELNIKNDLSVSKLAKECNFSLYHFSRLFYSITGLSPKSYIQKRKLSEAAIEIAETKNSIIAIAMDYGFNSAENFTRAFQTIFKIAPRSLRNDPTIISSVILLEPFTRKYLERFSATKSILKPDFRTIDSFYISGLKEKFKLNDDPSKIGALWEKFYLARNNVYGASKPKKYFEIWNWPATLHFDHFDFTVGIQTQEGIKQKDFTTFFVPEGLYAIFPHMGKSSDVYLTYQYIFQVWLPNSDCTLEHSFEFEYFGSDYLGSENSNSISEFFVPIKCK